MPHASLEMPDLVSLGAEFLRWEVATATAGLLLDINPFDEPNVQQAKDATRVLLDQYQQQHQLPFPESHGSSNGARLTLTEPAVDALGGNPADAFLRVAKAGDYIALLAYLPSDDPEWEQALQTFRQAIATRSAKATSVGFGPRYLHSTGQLHKGGAPNGVFIIITADATEDLAIPGARIRLACWRQRRRSATFSRSIAPDDAACSCDCRNEMSISSRESRNSWLRRCSPGRTIDRRERRSR